MAEKPKATKNKAKAVETPKTIQTATSEDLALELNSAWQLFNRARDTINAINAELQRRKEQ